MRKVLLYVLLHFVISTTAFAAGTTGKLTGTVFDKETNEAMIGASVRIEDTRIGATTDINGRYVILNVPAGTYTVRASYVGYQDVTVSNVKIIADFTQNLNFTLSSKGGAQVSEQIITAVRPLVERTTSNTQVITAEQIQNLPTRNGVQGIIGLTAGVVQDEKNTNNTYVRGGRAGEIAYYVDGVLQNNPFTLLGGGNVSQAATQEIVFLSGGFDAEYGNAASGIANITTKDPSVEKYVFSGELITDGYAGNSPVLGITGYGYNNYNLSASGPLLPFVPSLQKVTSIYLFAERQYQADATPTVGFGRLPGNSLGQWNMVGKIRFDLGSAGEFKVGANYVASSRQFFRYTTINNIYAVTAQNGVSTYQTGNNSDHNQRNEDRTLSTYLRYTKTLNAKSYFIANFNYFYLRNQTGDNQWMEDLASYGSKELNPGLAIDGRLTYPGVASSPFGSFDAQNLFINPGTPFNTYRDRITTYFDGGLTFETQVDVHNLKAGGQFRSTALRQYQINPRSLRDTTLDGAGGVLALAEAERAAGNISRADSLTTQAYRERTGTTAYGYDIFGNQVSGTNNGDGAKSPINASLYVQDKIELRDFIISLGLRYDYFTANDKKIKDAAQPIAFGDPERLDDADFENSDVFGLLSPRIAFSFPVSDRTVFHAQYGRFIQQPSLQYLYADRYTLEQVYLVNGSGSAINALNNPNLAPEKTTSYEVGFRQQFGDYVGLDITTYYKEVSDLIQAVSIGTVRTASTRSSYVQYVNQDFATTRGIEFSLQLRRINYVAATVNYTLGFGEGTGSSATTQALVAANGGTGKPNYALPLDYDQRHTGTVNVDIRTPLEDASLPGFARGWGANFLFTFNSGRPYTVKNSNTDFISGGGNTGGALDDYAKDIIVASPINGQYTNWNFRLDARLDKQFSLLENKLNFTAYIAAINLLNQINITGVYRTTGEPDNSSVLDTDPGRNNLASYGASYADQFRIAERNPNNFGTARQVRFGLIVSF